MVVRKIEEQEYEKAQDLYCESFHKQKKEVQLNLLGVLFGCFLNGELIGMVQFDFIHHIFEDLKILYINGFCIKNEYRHQGYGDKLLKWCIEYAKEHHFDMIQMTSNKNRIYAHKLYKKNNFEQIDTSIFKKEL